MSLLLSIEKIQPAMAASGGEEVSSLTADTVAGANFIARTTAVGIAPGDAETIEQFGQVNPRQVNQVSTRTAVGVAASIVARTTVGNNVARTTVGIEAVSGVTAWIAVAEATAKADIAERIQISKRKSGRSTGINFSARIAVSHDITRTAVCRIVTRSA